MTGTFHGDIPFEMATDTHRVAAARIEMRRIHDCIFAAAAHMTLRVAMTALAGDATVKKWLPAISVDGSGIARLDRAHMAAETTALHGQRRRHLRDLRQARLHIVAMRCCVPCYRRLKEVVIE